MASPSSETSITTTSGSYTSANINVTEDSFPNPEVGMPGKDNAFTNLMSVSHDLGRMNSPVCHKTVIAHVTVSEFLYETWF